MNHDEPFRRVSAWTPPELADEFEQLARERDRSIAAELRRAMRGHIEREREAAELERLDQMGSR